MNDFVKVELTQEQYERLKNEYDLRVKFKEKHFTQEFTCRSSSGQFYRYVGPNARLKEIATLKENEQFYKRKIDFLESQVKDLVKGLEKTPEKAKWPWWKLW